MRTRSITVYFYLALPRDGTPWPGGTYPADKALQVIQDLDPRDRRIQYALMYSERVGNVTGEAPNLLLSVENVDVGAHLRIAQEGAVSTYEFADNEGPAEPTYAMFLEHNVVAVVRLGPPAAAIASYLGQKTDYDLKLVPIESSEVASQLHRPDSDFKQISMTVAMGNAKRLAQATRIGEAFTLAEDLIPSAEEITITFKVKSSRKTSRGRFWSKVRPEIAGLMSDKEALDQLEAANVGVAGEPSFSLLEDLVTWKASVPADQYRHIDEFVIASSMLEAYQQNRSRILQAIGR